MRVLTLSFVLAIPWIVSAQDSGGPSDTKAPASKTYTSPDGTFQFTYPALLIRCELQPENNGDSYGWVQPECNSYHPVCGDNPTPREPLVCIAYPSNQHTHDDNFEAAVFSASETEMSEKDCLSDEVRKGKTVKIGRVKFYFVEETDGGMNQARHSKGYVSFHNGKCYAIGTTVATASVVNEPRNPAKRDWAEIYGKLEQARDSFRFLK